MPVSDDLMKKSPLFRGNKALWGIETSDPNIQFLIFDIRLNCCHPM